MGSQEVSSAEVAGVVILEVIDQDHFRVTCPNAEVACEFAGILQINATFKAILDEVQVSDGDARVVTFRNYPIVINPDFLRMELDSMAKMHFFDPHIRVVWP